MNIFLENYMPNLYSECAIKCIKLYNISKFLTIVKVAFPIDKSYICSYSIKLLLR